MDPNSLEYLAMIRLLKEVGQRCPGGRFPDDYLVVDTETTGTNPYSDKILQIGFCFVSNRKAVASFAQILKRPGLKIPEEAKKIHHIDEKKLEGGLEPRKYIPEVVATLNNWRSKGRMFAGHNMMSFDAPLLEREMTSLGHNFKFGDNDVLDTGMLVKAAQLGMYTHPGESLHNFWLRVSEVRSRTKWSLAGHCYVAYNLAKYGLPLEKAHDAESDCRLSHYLMEELRLMSTKSSVAAN